MKPLKLPNEDDNDNFLRRLEHLESKKRIATDSDSEIHQKCEELRFERIKKLTEIMGYNSALEHQRDDITDYELAWELECALRVPPEVRYQNKKKDWEHHELSWFMRKLPMNDESCCNYYRCVPECRFYPEEGMIEDSEIINEHEERNKKEREKIAERNRLLGFNDNDSDEVKKQKWDEIHKVKNRINDLTSEFLHQRQHTGCKWEEVKAIEDAVWAEFYEKIKERQQQQQQQRLL